MSKSYLELYAGNRKCYSLIPAGVKCTFLILLKMYFITNTLHVILRIFPNSSWAGSEHRAFKLCAFIVMFTMCFYLFIFVEL